MRTVRLGSAAVILLLWQTLAPAAHAGAGTAGSAQEWIVKCRQMYGGDRGRAINHVKSMLVESCFKQATGRYPFELGTPIYPSGYDWFINPDRY
jgi:hypothetical protein